MTLGFGAIPDSEASAGSTNESVISIADDDDPFVTASFEIATQTAAEGESVVITVNLSAEPERTVTIPFDITHPSGGSSDDYTGAENSVTFNSTSTTESFTITITDDEIDDDDESVRIAFGSLPHRVLRGSPGETTINIEDDDNPIVSVRFASASYTVAEGGERRIQVRLSAAPERRISIPITVMNDTATAADYSGLPGALDFSATDTTSQFRIMGSDDGEVDGGETLTISLVEAQLPDRVSLGSPSETTVTILDDDDLPPAPAGLFGTGESGTANLIISWNRTTDDTVTGYEYRYKLSTEEFWFIDWTLVPDSTIDTVEFTIPGLADGLEYEFEVAGGAWPAGRTGVTQQRGSRRGG